MRGPRPLAMTDVASRPRGGKVWASGAAVCLLLVVYAGIRIGIYVHRGMLGPNFPLIHAAYDFIFGEWPVWFAASGAGFAAFAVARPPARRSAGVVAAVLLFFCGDLLVLRHYVTHVEPERLVLRRVRLETTKLSEPLSILHISDIQAGRIGPYQKRIFERIREIAPDLVLNTGDYLQVVPPTTFAEAFDDFMALVRSAEARHGMFGVFGDTDYPLYRFDAEELAPLRLLSSRSADVETPGGVVSLHGLSLYQSKNPEWALRGIRDWLDRSADSEFRILLGHAPDFAKAVETLPVDLCLAGHTHGGQVRLPLIGPLVIDSDVPKAWARGFRRVGVPHLNVSAGAGSNRYGGLPPLRFNCPTEMTLIELVPVRGIR